MGALPYIEVGGLDWPSIPTGGLDEWGRPRPRCEELLFPCFTDAVETPLDTGTWDKNPV